MAINSGKAVVLGVAHPHVFHLAELARDSAQVGLAGVYDPDPSLAARAGERLGVRTFETLEQAFSAGPALALVGAIPGERAALAERAAEAGAAVLVDKPLALTHADLDRVIRAVERYQRPIITYYPFRGTPLILAARAALAEGRIGKLVRVYSAGPHKLNATNRPAWHFTRAGNGGILIDIASHSADLCCWFAEQTPAWISALHVNRSQPNHPEFQDFGQAQFRFPDQTLAHIDVDWLNPTSMRHFGDTRFWLQGTEGKIEVRMGDTFLGQIWNSELAQAPLIPDAPDTNTWTTRLLEDLAAGRPGAIPQEEVFRASRVTLWAFESAMADGKPVVPGDIATPTSNL